MDKQSGFGTIPEDIHQSSTEQLERMVVHYRILL
jgi:hypothetical protein